MSSPDQVIISVETLTGGTADRFVIAAGAGQPVGQETAAQVKTRLNLSGTNSGDQDLSGYATTSALNAKANLASPALTGTPTTPTASGGTNTTQIASTAFVTAAVAAAVTGLLEFQGNIDCSANPNYPAGSKGDTYYVSVAGKIGGASGTTVAVGDAVVCKADNAGGTEASVGTSWFVLEKNLAGALLSANNLSDVASAATSRTNLGIGTIATKSTYVIQVALSGYDTAVSAGTKKGQCRVPFAGTITGFLIVCDPANKPSAAAIQCDLNTVNSSTGVLTTVLSSVASIATGAAVSTGGAISGSPSVAAGDQLAIDIDQGSDGKGLVATITITAT